MMAIQGKLFAGVTIAATVIIGFLYFMWQNASDNFEEERSQRLKAEAQADNYLTQVKTLATSVTEAETRLEQQRLADLERVRQLQSELDGLRDAEEQANRDAEELERIEREAGNIQTFDSRGIY